MKSTIIAVLMVTLSAAFAYAGQMTKLGFRAYSSASQIECGVFGMNQKLKTDAVGGASGVIQGFSPDDKYSRNLSLGTKGFVNYSTLYGKTNLTAIAFTCRIVATSANSYAHDITPVKVYLNGVETYFLTLGTGQFIGGYQP
jgi:hypothetical protein